jgi:hypothetical protein
MHHSSRTSLAVACPLRYPTLHKPILRPFPDRAGPNEPKKSFIINKSLHNRTQNEAGGPSLVRRHALVEKHHIADARTPLVLSCVFHGRGAAARSSRGRFSDRTSEVRAKGAEMQVRRNRGWKTIRPRLGSPANTGSLSPVPRRVERYRG